MVAPTSLPTAENGAAAVSSPAADADAVAVPGAGGAAAPAPVPPPAIDPAVREGLHVLEAHLAANKVTLARALFGGAGRGAGFAYAGLRDALRTMAVEGAAGAAGGDDGRAYSLVDVAAFLAASARDSVRRGGATRSAATGTRAGAPVGGGLPLWPRRR